MKSREELFKLGKDEKKREERTRRLIQIGAIAIKYLGCQNGIEPAKFDEQIKKLVDEETPRKM